MQSLADEHCNPPWCHLTQHCIFPAPFLVGLVSSHLGCFLWGGFWALISVLPLCLSLAVARLAPKSFPVGFLVLDFARWII